MRIPHAVYLLALMWLLHLSQTLLWVNLSAYGIVPREISGLFGIPFAPWIHHNWLHLISNSIPFLILGTLVQTKNTTVFWEATFLIIVIAGAGTWLLGSAGYHVGASGLILGYLSFIIIDAYFQKSFKAIFVAAISFAIYGSLLFTLFDFRPQISWAGHVSGLIAGVMVAILSHKKTPDSINRA